MHHSGHDEYPLRSDFDLLDDLDGADSLKVQKLQVEATVKLAASLSSIAEAIQTLSHVDMGLMINSYGNTLRIEQADE